MKSGFWQIKMDEESKQYTAFTVGNLGFFECERMPFGLCNAPATFQRLMQNCLGELNLTFCIVYLDDVIVFSDTEEEHVNRLRVVFERFREYNLKLKPSKCNLFRSEITYLAHHVSKEGVRPSKKNVEAILAVDYPTTYSQIRAFLGLMGHYRRFIKNYSKKTRFLSQYLTGEGSKKSRERVKLTDDDKQQIDFLKGLLVQAPILAFADFHEPFRLETDASKEGLGAVCRKRGTTTTGTP